LSTAILAVVPPSTYSIVACDLDRREWGVAVQSKFLAVGALAPWVEAEVGAVATQAWLNVGWGAEALALLREGLAAAEVVERLPAADPGRAQRQLGVVDAHGRSATYTGEGCLDWAGGRTGDGYAVQGNILVSGDTVDAMAATFEETRDAPLAERLLAALERGQAAGGDRRGQQAAALLVARRGAGYSGYDVPVDLRVDDHERPLAELRRLYELHELYFGSTPAEEWLPVADELGRELTERLARIGYATGDLAADLEAWAGFVNLEERVDGAEKIDPVVLAELRKEMP
jgi:uncharacterized Ntn-hydrolase superfamily protein